MKYLRIIGNFFKNFYDKIVLGILLIVFAIVLVSQTKDLQKTQEAVNKGDQDLQAKLPTNEIEGVSEKILKVQLEPDQEQLWQKYHGEGSLVHPGKYVHSLDGSPYLLHRTTKRSPFTGKSNLLAESANSELSDSNDSSSKDDENKDSDSDGIPDLVETQKGLDKKEPGDAMLDLDGDGFSNIEEYKSETDLSDAGSRPKLVTCLRYLRKVRQSVNIKLKKINTNNQPDDKSSWDMHVSYKSGKRWKSDFLKIGSEIQQSDGYVIKDAQYSENFENKIAVVDSSITIQKENEEPITLLPNKRAYAHKDYYEFVYIYDKKATKIKIILEEQIPLEDANGNQEIYKVVNINKGQATAKEVGFDDKVYDIKKYSSDEKNRLLK